MVLQSEKASWVRYMNQRIERRKNFITFISGPTGSGKSWTSLAIAELVDPNFDVERVVFSGKALMKLINSGKLKKGSVIVFEEAGVEMSNRNWQSVVNKMINYLFQTFRHRNFILIMNAPYMDFVDSATRKLFHAEWQVTGIDFDKSQTKVKPQVIQYNSRNSKFYYKYLRVITKEGVVPVKKWNVDRPSSELINAYEKKKREFTDALNKKINAELNSMQKKIKEKYPAWCAGCGYRWDSTKQIPSKCPKCHSKKTKLADLGGLEGDVPVLKPGVVHTPPSDSSFTQIG